MARIRTIKPEFWTSEQVADCSPTARLLFIGMWNFCDDYGIHPASTKRLKMEVFPADNLSADDIERLIDELREAGLIREYTAEGQDFWAVTGWHHQKIEKKVSKYPPPPPLSVADSSPTPRRPIADHSPPEGKGRESNGMDGNGVETRDIQSIVKGIAENKKIPSGLPSYQDGPDAKANRKARWEQNCMTDIRATYPDAKAELIVASYMRGERWGKQEFENADKRIKSRRSFGSAA